MAFVQYGQIIVFEDVLDDACVYENCRDVFFVRSVDDIEKCRNGRPKNNCFPGVLVEICGVSKNVVVRYVLESSCFGGDSVETAFVLDEVFAVLSDGNTLVRTESQFFAGREATDLFICNLGNVPQDLICEKCD